jgi:N-acetylmuramoyl-L-alanine amidase
MNNRFVCMLIGLLLSLVSAIPAAAEDYASLRSDYRALVQSSQMQRQRVNWEQLIQRFNRFIVEPAAQQDREKATFLRARTWDGLSRASGRGADARIAIELYGEFADIYPASCLSDDSLYLAGQLAEETLDDKEQAYGLYQRLLLDHASGDMASDALKRLVQLPVPKSVQALPAAGESSTSVSGAAASGSATLVNIRYWSGPEYTRIVLDLTAAVNSKPQLLTGESPRLYFDLKNTDLSASLSHQISIDNGLVRQVRTSIFDRATSRVVIDLNRVVDYKVTVLKDPDRLVIDLEGVPQQVAISSGAAISAPVSAGSIATILEKSADKQSILHVPQQSHSVGIKTIVVDAGHGGNDPGAVGPGGIYEKTVTLQLAKLLAQKLEERLGVKVLMTRSDDSHLELRERTDYANKVGADLFVSLHANASTSSTVYGTETFFLNLSKNDQAAEVAARENGTSLEEVGNLEAILFDLMANAKINESSRLAAEVQQSLITGLQSHYSNVKDRGVKQGPFSVLLGATMPSVLVEAAFISNSREEKRLTNQAYQQRVADAIVDGIKNYSTSIEQVARQ